jgi:hypothetical protein
VDIFSSAHIDEGVRFALLALRSNCRDDDGLADRPDRRRDKRLGDNDRKGIDRSFVVSFMLISRLLLLVLMLMLIGRRNTRFAAGTPISPAERCDATL